MSIRLKIILPFLALTILVAFLATFMIVKLTGGILGSGGLRIYVLFFVAVLLSVTAVGYGIALTILKPLDSLVRTVKTVAGGDLTRRTEIKSGDEVGVLANTFDEMTGHLQQQVLELEKTNRILEQMDQAKMRFIHVAAHELRTPLTPIMGLSAMLVEKAKVNNPAISKYAGGILDGSARMNEIIDSMLDISRIDTNQLDLLPSEVEIFLVIEKVEKTFQAALQERKISLVTTGLPNLPVIRADKDLLYKVFYHVIGNAIKYTPDGGQVTVNGRCVEDSSQNEIEITVRDTGIGIDPENQELVFEKFYQTGEVLLHSSGKTKFKGGGPGLGLAIARGIVNAHRGRIWLESPGYDEENCPGSIFYIRLPGAAEKTEE